MEIRWKLLLYYSVYIYIQGYIGFYIRMMEKKMETTIWGLPAPNLYLRDWIAGPHEILVSWGEWDAVGECLGVTGHQYCVDLPQELSW